MSDIELSTRERSSLGDLQISRASGGLLVSSGADARAVAELMAKADIGIRKHLRGNVGACLSIVLQADFWGLTPYQVGNKSYLVNDQIAYEAQLIQAVIQMRAPIRGRIKTEYKGEGPTRQLRVWAKIKDDDGDDEIVEYTSPKIVDIKPKNSPLWVNDPDQQLHYFSVRAWCRRHFPEVLLGVYAEDEVPPTGYIDAEYRETTARESMADKLDRIAAPPHDPDTGEIKDEQPAPAAAAPAKPKRETKAKPEPVKAEVQPEPVKVTSGRLSESEKAADAPRNPIEDERASQQEIAAAAGAFDDDSFGRDDEPEPEPVSPFRKIVDDFKVVLQGVKDEDGLEKERKSFVKHFKDVPRDNPFYQEASALYSAAVERVRTGAAAPAKTQPAKAEPVPQAAAQAEDGGGMSADDEAELERILTYDLDHTPRAIDTGDLAQVKAYIQGIKAAEKGRAIGAVPAIYGEVEAVAWVAGHNHVTSSKEA
ncbi:MAG: recombinase RecT [Burkholderiales bacterium]|nr:recombinase RecT [Burkholderiales bacterium]